jgi:multiple sugar transport system permease protein
LLQNRFGPGAAVSLATAPFLAIFILLLARFMRGGVDKASNNSAGDRIFAGFGKLINGFMALIVWPITAVSRLIGRGVSAITTPLARSIHGNKPGAQTLLLNRHQRERAGTIVRFLLIIPFLLFVLFPFIWIIITAFKSELQISQRVSIWWPEPWTLDQFNTLLTKTDYTLWFRNTVFVSTITTVLSVLFAALGGYALARLKFRGAGALTTVLLITYLLPASLMFIPMYRILTGVGAINTHMALILTYPTFLMPFATWVMLGYYRGIPEDLEEAAMIDGANRFGAFWRITLPLAMPALLAVTLFAFTNAWNEFLYAFIFLTSETLITLPVGLQKLVFADIYPYGQLMAASLIMSIPVVIMYIFAQRFVVEGLTAGSVKG